MEQQDQDTEFVNWLEEHQAILHKVANSFAAPSDRDDLMQQMLVGLWRAFPRFRGDSKRSTFVYRVVHNCALTWVRGETRRRRRESDIQSSSQVSDSAAAKDDPRIELLYECIRELTTIDRLVITMSLDGLCHAEIADVIGIGENAVAVRLHRVRKRLSEAMKGKMK